MSPHVVMVTTHIIVVPLNNFQEESWSVLHILGEDLEQIAILIIVYQYTQLLQL